MKTRDEASKAAEAEQEPTRKYGWGGGLAPSRNKVAEEMPRVETKDGGAASYTKREPSKTTDQHIAEEEEEFETPSWLQRAVDHLAARMLHERHTAAAAESPNKAKTADAVAESTDTSVGGEGKGGVDEEPAATDDSAGALSVVSGDEPTSRAPAAGRKRTRRRAALRGLSAVAAAASRLSRGRLVLLMLAFAITLAVPVALALAVHVYLNGWAQLANAAQLSPFGQYVPAGHLGELGQVGQLVPRGEGVEGAGPIARWLDSIGRGGGEGGDQLVGLSGAGAGVAGGVLVGGGGVLSVAAAESLVGTFGSVLREATKRGDAAATAAAKTAAAAAAEAQKRREAEAAAAELRQEVAALREALKAKEEALSRLEDMHSLTSHQQQRDAACCAAFAEAKLVHAREAEAHRGCVKALKRADAALARSDAKLTQMIDERPGTATFWKRMREMARPP